MFSEESFIDFECPHCGEAASFPQADVGYLRECPNCLEPLLVPQPGTDMGGKIPLPVVTSRLRLRRFQPNDWQALMELMPEAGEEYVLRFLESDRQVRLTTPEQTFNLGIELSAGEKLIGYVTLRFRDAERQQALMSIQLQEPYALNDFGAEAIDALLGFCFDGIRLHRVQATCGSEETGLLQLFEAVGLRREGEFLKDTHLPDGSWGSSVWFGALAEEYESGEDKGA